MIRHCNPRFVSEQSLTSSRRQTPVESTCPNPSSTLRHLSPNKPPSQGYKVHFVCYTIAGITPPAQIVSLVAPSSYRFVSAEHSEARGASEFMNAQTDARQLTTQPPYRAARFVSAQNIASDAAAPPDDVVPLTDSATTRYKGQGLLLSVDAL